MVKHIFSTITLAGILVISLYFAGCSQKDNETTNKNNLQYLADKEKELNDREAKIRLKEVELEQRENKLGITENKTETTTTGVQTTDTTQMTDAQKKEAEKKQKTEDLKKKKEVKKEIQKEMTQKFEDPKVTVKDYYEYIQRGINEEGNFDANMQKAQKYFPTRTVDKLKGGYRHTKSFTVVDEPKVVSQKGDKSVVQTKVKQVEVVKKDGHDTEVTKTLLVTYNLSANKEGQWVITGNSVKSE